MKEPGRDRLDGPAAGPAAGGVGGRAGQPAGQPRDLAGEPEPVQRVRRLCLALPEATERLSHGEPTWFVQDRKVFVMFADRHHDDRVALWCAAPPGEQQARTTAEPERYFVPPYVGGRGWLGVYLDVPVDWDEVAEIITEAYRQIAPKRLVVTLEERIEPGPSGHAGG